MTKIIILSCFTYLPLLYILLDLSNSSQTVTTNARGRGSSSNYANAALTPARPPPLPHGGRGGRGFCSPPHSRPGFPSPPGGNGRGGDGVVCMCGEEAKLLTVRNEQSANKGKHVNNTKTHFVHVHCISDSIACF